MVWLAGQSLKGNRYIIQRKIGSGGFGITYLAQDGKGRQWVIKTILDELINISSADKRNKYLLDFKNEALLLALCRHRHIVHIDNIFNEQDLPCIVMEYIQGMNLKKRVEDRGVLSEAEAVRYTWQIGEALMVVHDKGFLHRDLKPENIMVRPTQDEAVLIDFGIARDFVPDVTQRHTEYRTEGFAPVEQYDEQGHRGEYTDVYALAATFVTLVTGSPPPPSFMRTRRDSFQVPTGVSASVQKAIKEGMAVQPEDRTQTVEEWLDLLQVSVPKIQNFLLNPLFSPVEIQAPVPLGSVPKIQNFLLNPPISSVEIKAPVRYQPLGKIFQGEDWRGAEQETPFDRGYALRELGRYEEAIAAYDKALKIKPDYHLAWDGRGVALNELGRYEEAIAAYDKALKIKPDFHEAWNNRGVTLNKLGRYKEAIAAYDKAIEIKPDKYLAWHGRGNILEKLGRYKEAIAAYDKALEIKPDYHNARNGRGNILEALGRYKEAIAAYNKAIEIKPDYHEAWNNRGIALRKLGRYEEALASYNKSIEIKPDYHEAWNNRGIALRKLGRYEEALASYNKAIEIKPDYHDARNNRDIALRKSGRN